jgi:hypothetical protein
MTIFYILLIILAFNSLLLLGLGFLTWMSRREIRQLANGVRAIRQHGGGSAAILDEQDEQQELRRTQEILDKAAARKAVGQEAQITLHTDSLAVDEVIMDDDRPFKR